jgi:hypothetical protein
VHQHGAAGFEFLREHGHGIAGAGNEFAMRFGLPGRAFNFGSAVADRDNETRRGRDVFGHRVSGVILLRDRAVDVFEYRPDRLDRLGDPMHRIDRTGGVLLQGLNLPGDLLGGVLGLHRQRLDLGSNDREAAPGRTRTRRLDRGVERQQRRLLGDVGDQVDDIADRGRRLAQPIHIGAGFARGSAGLVSQFTRTAHL